MLRYWKAILLILLLLAAGLTYYGYSLIYSPNVPDKLAQTSLNIPQGTDFAALTQLLNEKGIIEDASSFELVSKFMKFDKGKNISGRFEITPG